MYVCLLLVYFHCLDSRALLSTCYVFQPLTDFANVWVSQGSGARLLSLSPSPHCVTRCHPVSVLMQPGDLREYFQTSSTAVVTLRK